MKKLVAKHNLTQKIFLSIIIVLLLSFSVPVKSQAGLGGILLDPLFDLIGTVLDVCVGGLQAFLVDGQLNNSNGSSNFNFFLADKDDFMSKIGSDYKEFAYTTGGGQAQVTISEEELDKSFFGNSNYAIPVMKYSPEKIFSGLVPALDINFVNPTDWGSQAMNERSIARALHETIASWYVSLRNLCVVGLMLVLTYVGIRIVISSTASDKAKFKQMLMDWVVAMCILFCMHYIMTFTTTIVTEISRAITGSANSNGNNVAVQVVDENGSPTGTEFNTDLMGLLRFKMQAPTVGGKVLYLILYLAMVIYTFMFTFYYLKRVLTMAFLTLISPMVALTYPIDKIRDGKAQAFDMWLKEYIFNALLQPFHLIIYSIFVGSAIDLAAKNPLYAIIALAFITPAEKILRKFFGFEKASTASALGAVASAAGGAALMGQMQKLMSPKKGGGSGSSKGIRNKNKPEDSAPSLGDAFGKGNESLENENPEDVRQQMLDAYDEGFGTDDWDPAERDAMAREANNSQGMTYTDDEYRQILEDSGYEGDELEAMMAERRGYYADNTPSAPSTPPTPPTSSINTDEDDTRGVLAWGMDALANTGFGQGAARFGRTVANGAKSVRDMAAARAQRIGEAYRKIPKPIRNTLGNLGSKALGVGNAALQTGLKVGKTALKAAPGAIVGMAAGIASDEIGDIAKYTLVGAGLSSTVGSSAVAGAGSFIADAYRQGSGSSYQASLDQRRKEYMKDNEELYSQKFPEASKKELKEKLEQGAYYDSVGIEGKDTIKAVKLEEKIKKEMAAAGIAEEEAAKRSQAQTAAIMKEVKDYSAKDLRDADVVRDLRTDLSSRLESQGLRGDEKMKTIDMIVKEMKSVRGVKNDY